MTRLEDYGGQQWGVAPPLNKTAPENWEPKIVKMTRLEEIESWLTRSVRSQLQGTCQPTDDMARNLLYRGDAYKARVAVLEEALAFYAHSGKFRPEPYSIVEVWQDGDTHTLGVKAAVALALSPEQCLEQQKGVG